MGIQTGSIDLKAAKKAHEDASKYITKLNDSGIKVHPYNDTNHVVDLNNYVGITSAEVSIVSNGTQRVSVDEDGLYIKDELGKTIAQYGDDAIIGNTDDFHIKIDGEEIGFYQGQNNKVAKMNGSELYVSNSLSFGAAPHGTFIFMQRSNGHFTLKLIK